MVLCPGLLRHTLRRSFYVFPALPWLTSLCSPRSSSPNFTTSSTMCRPAMVPASPFYSFTTCHSTSSTGLLFQDLLWFPPSLRVGENYSGGFSSVKPYNVPVFDNAGLSIQSLLQRRFLPSLLLTYVWGNKERRFNGVAAP